MRIESLSLRNFRNLDRTELEPAPGLNFLVGDNGQGKTSLLEAISYLSTLRSFRGAKGDEVIRWGNQEAEATCTIAEDGGDWQTALKVAFLENAGRVAKTAFVNGKPFRSSTQYLTQRFGSYRMGFHSVVFNPADHDLVRGEPALRRAYLDRVLAAEDPDYLTALTRYSRVLEQRNGLLRREDSPSRDLLASFNAPLVEHGSVVTRKRMEWWQRASSPLLLIAKELAPHQPALTVDFHSKWAVENEFFPFSNNHLVSGESSGQDPLPTLEILSRSLEAKLAALEAAELRMRTTLSGPHRDDWQFRFGSQVLKGHGSQGEVRSALLALKLTEIRLFRDATGHRPLLLLDDFSSELDRERRSYLLKFLTESDLQVFVTTTDDALFAGKRFRVAKGALQTA